jgi:hypothetical protein
MNHDFSFAEPIRIHRVIANNSPQIFQLLNAAHPKLISLSFLGWRLRLGSDGVR